MPKKKKKKEKKKRGDRGCKAGIELKLPFHS
jgi:hypothetical protein